jgi:hypothetical protein
LEGAKSGIQEDCKKELDPQKRLNEGGGHPTREQPVLAVGKRLLSHIKLLGPRQRINIQLEENQKAINPQRSDLNNKTKDYRRKGNTTEAEELRKPKDQIPSRVWNDWGFRQMFYMQYANSILIIFIASKDEVLIS